MEKVFLNTVAKLSRIFEEWVSSRTWPQCKPWLRAATAFLSGRIHLSQTNGGVKLSLFIYPSSPESSIFQLQAAGKPLWREVCDPDDSNGTAPNCEKLILKIQTGSRNPCDRMSGSNASFQEQTTADFTVIVMLKSLKFDRYWPFWDWIVQMPEACTDLAPPMQTTALPPLM